MQNRNIYPRSSLFSGGEYSDGSVVGYSEPVYGLGYEVHISLNNDGGASVIMQRRPIERPEAVWSDIGFAASVSKTHRMLLQSTHEYRWFVQSAGNMPVYLLIFDAVPDSLDEQPSKWPDALPYSNGFDATEGLTDFLAGLAPSELVIRWTLARAEDGFFTPGDPTLGSDGRVYYLNDDVGNGSPGNPLLDPVSGTGTITESWVLAGNEKNTLTTEFIDASAPDPDDIPNDLGEEGVSGFGSIEIHFYNDLIVVYKRLQASWIELGRKDSAASPDWNAGISDPGYIKNKPNVVAGGSNGAKTYRFTSASPPAAPAKAESPTREEILAIAVEAGVIVGDTVFYETPGGAEIEYKVAIGDGTLAALRVTQRPHYTAQPDFSNFTPGVNWWIEILYAGRLATGYISGFGEFIEAEATGATGTNFIDVVVNNEVLGTDEFWAAFPEADTIALWTEARVLDEGPSNNSHQFYRGFEDGVPAWKYIGQFSSGVPTRSVTIDTVSGDDAVSATERLSDIVVSASLYNIPDGTAVIVAINDANGITITRPLVASNDAVSTTYPPAQLRGYVGPLLIECRASVDGDVISDTKIVPFEPALLVVDPITGDDLVSGEDLLNPIDITGEAEPDADVDITGDITTSAVADDEGIWRTPNIQPQLQALGNGEHDYSVGSNGQTIPRTVQVAIATTAAVTDLAHDPIDPANPSTTRVTVTHTGESPMSVTLRGLRGASEVEEVLITKQNNSGTVTHIDIPSEEVAKLTSPSKYQIVLRYQGNDSAPYEEDVTYAVVTDPVGGDPLPSETFTKDFPTAGQNFHRKNTGFSEWMYWQNGVQKELHGWFADNSHWYMGNSIFPAGQIANYRDVHNQCNITVRDDNHNTCAVAVTAAGTFLFIADIHAHDVQGGYTTTAYDDTFASMVPITPSMFPSNSVDRVTYPQFFEFKGHTYLFMRELDSGGGTPNFISRIYRWRETQKDFVIAVDLNAGIKLRNYLSNFAVSPDGNRLGFVGLFRDDNAQPNGTSQQKDIYYLYTESDLSQANPVFKAADGTVQQMPVWWDNGLGTEGVTAYLVNDKIFDTGPDPIPNKAGAVILDQFNQPHIFADLKDGNKYYCYRNQANDGWIKRVVTFSENSSAMVGYGGVVGFGVHTGNDFRFHPVDENDPNYQSGILLADDFYSGGAFVYRPNYQAMYAGYLTMNLFKNKSSGTGTSGSFITSMKHRIVPFTQLGVEIIDDPDSVDLFVEDIAGDGIVSLEESSNPVTIKGSVGEAATISFVGEFSIAPITLSEDGPFESEDIVSKILEERTGDISVIATTPDGRTASIAKPFSAPDATLSIPAYNAVEGVSIINKIEGENGIIFEGLAPGSNGQTVTFVHSHPDVELPEYIVVDGKFDLELPAGEIAKTNSPDTYTIKAKIGTSTFDFVYQWHKLTFANTIGHTQYNPGDPFDVTVGTESNKGPWKFGLHITDIDDVELWSYQEITSPDKPVVFNLTASDTDGWPTAIKLHPYNENIFRNGQTDTLTVSSYVPRVNVIGSAVGDVEKILTIPVSTSQENAQMSTIDNKDGYIFTANVEPGVNGDSDDTTLHSVMRRGIQLSDLTWDWDETLIEDRTANDSFHAAPGVGVDDLGIVHVAYNMHNTPWQYKKSKYPIDIIEFDFHGQAITQEEIDRWKFQNKTDFPTFGHADIPGNGITYPRFQKNRSGELYVTYRQTAKPAQAHADRMYSTGVAKYNTTTKQWTPLGVTFPVSEPDDYQSDSRSPDAATIIAGEAGWTASIPRLMFGPNDELHIVGYWIEGTASGTFTRPFHIMSTDDVNFTDIEGNALTLPITSNVGTAGLGFPTTTEFESIGDCVMDSTGKAYIVHSPKVGSREILTYNTGTTSWDSEASPNAAFELFVDSSDNLYALATGLTVLKRLNGSSTWTTVYTDTAVNRYPRASVNEDGSIAYIHTHSDDEQSVSIYALRLT